MKLTSTASSLYATLQCYIGPSQKCPDDDLVPKDNPATKRVKTESQQQPKIPPPNNLPEQDPLIIKNDLERSKPKLPSGVNKESPIKLFKLFLMDEWL